MWISTVSNGTMLLYRPTSKETSKKLEKSKHRSCHAVALVQSFMQILVDANCLHTKKLLADSWHDYILGASIFHASLTHVISQQKPPGDFWPLVWVCTRWYIMPAHKVEINIANIDWEKKTCLPRQSTPSSHLRPPDQKKRLQVKL